MIEKKDLKIGTWYHIINGIACFQGNFKMRNYGIYYNKWSKNLKMTTDNGSKYSIVSNQEVYRLLKEHDKLDKFIKILDNYTMW